MSLQFLTITYTRQCVFSFKIYILYFPKSTTESLDMVTANYTEGYSPQGNREEIKE